MQCQTDATLCCTCELCGALETPLNSPDLLSLGEQFFTVIAQVIVLVVGQKKITRHHYVEGKKIPRAMATGLHVQFYFPREWKLTLLTSVSGGVNSLHLYMWVEWQLLMVSDACSLQFRIPSPEAPSTPAKKG